jgi:hypothetical protein
MNLLKLKQRLLREKFNISNHTKEKERRKRQIERGIIKITQ